MRRFAPIKSIFHPNPFQALLGLSLAGSLFAGLRLGVLAWLIFMVTGSSFSVGLSFTVRALPAILLGPLGGAIADLFDRRYLVAIDRAILAGLSAITGALVATGKLQPWHLLVLAAASGSLFAFSEPSLFAMLNQSFSPKWANRSASLRAVTLDVGEAIGPLAVGFVIAYLGVEYVFWIMTAGFAAVSVLVLRVPHSFAHAKVHNIGSIWMQLRAGMVFVSRKPALIWVGIIALLNNLTGVGIFPLLPKFATENLESGVVAYGLLAGMLGTGLLVGALGASVLLGSFKRLSIPLVLGSIAWDGLLILFGFQSSLWLSAALLFCIGLAGSTWIAAATSIYQKSTSSALRPRVISVLLAAMQFAPVGWLIGGALGESIGIQMTLIVSAVVSSPVALLGWIASSEFRKT